MTNNPAKATTVHLGKFRIDVVSGGRFKIDGGTMFGVVPKNLWSRRIDADADNNIQQDTNCLLIDTGRDKVLIDTGYGGKLSDKQRKILSAESGEPLLASLRQLGIEPHEIDVVVLSHLHFDHAGGASRTNETHELAPAFPNAQYVVQRREWMVANADLPELRGSYTKADFQVLHAADCLRLIDGPEQIVPGITALPTGGHTAGHQAIKIANGNETAVYLGDLCPTSHHLPVRWGMGFDLDVVKLRRMKDEILAAIAQNQWLAYFDHDPQLTCARLRRDDKRDYAVCTD
jgi:glyoxylase-like metal-dependent hydrolase (beta-lactamase superfamily II)